MVAKRHNVEGRKKKEKRGKKLKKKNSPKPRVNSPSKAIGGKQGGRKKGKLKVGTRRGQASKPED